MNALSLILCCETILLSLSLITVSLTAVLLLHLRLRTIAWRVSVRITVPIWHIWTSRILRLIVLGFIAVLLLIRVFRSRLRRSLLTLISQEIRNILFFCFRSCALDWLCNFL